MQARVALDQQVLTRQAGVAAEAFGSSRVADADRLQPDPDGSQPRQRRHERLRIFEAVKVTQLTEHHDKPLLPWLHARDSLQAGAQCVRGLHGRDLTHRLPLSVRHNAAPRPPR